ncbi:hypothetical protein [Bacillus swezeyi]|uniref:Uncharacterized protein n=1 Tax=Bacillus swezeyi TaxID=1925020 RepID=A0A5M8RLZ9_9BACI|nr:hypothetical protein [Bacillus swezeyi]KAA6446952.1 hypothetical protein DX927_23155 [Bacillus swezeyi]KAA6471520.1 hypothetical protein DX928_23395 [Bacillus swezeyi]
MIVKGIKPVTNITHFGKYKISKKTYPLQNGKVGLRIEATHSPFSGVFEIRLLHGDGISVKKK